MADKIGRKYSRYSFSVVRLLLTKPIGLLISCATPADIMPIDTIFSDCTRWDWLSMRLFCASSKASFFSLNLCSRFRICSDISLKSENSSVYSLANLLCSFSSTSAPLATRCATALSAFIGDTNHRLPNHTNTMITTETAMKAVINKSFNNLFLLLLIVLSSKKKSIEALGSIFSLPHKMFALSSPVAKAGSPSQLICNANPCNPERTFSLSNLSTGISNTKIPSGDS